MTDREKLDFLEELDNTGELVLSKALAIRKHFDLYGVDDNMLIKLELLDSILYECYGLTSEDYIQEN